MWKAACLGEGIGAEPTWDLSAAVCTLCVFFAFQFRYIKNWEIFLNNQHFLRLLDPWFSFTVLYCNLLKCMIVRTWSVQFRILDIEVNLYHSISWKQNHYSKDDACLWLNRTHIINFCSFVCFGDSWFLFTDLELIRDLILENLVIRYSA